MLWFNDVILFLHFVGLVTGAGPGMANMVVMRQAAAATAEGAAALRRVPPILAKVSAAGVVVLWVTGLIMVWSKWNGLASMPPAFWIKMIFVVALTVVMGLMHKTLADIRRTGNTALAARLPRLGPLAGLSALFAVLFAVFAFH